MFLSITLDTKSNQILFRNNNKNTIYMYMSNKNKKVVLRGGHIDIIESVSKCFRRSFFVVRAARKLVQVTSDTVVPLFSIIL